MTSTTPATTPSSSSPPLQTRPSFPKLDERTAKILWRDSFFLVLGAVVLLVVGYVETNAPNESARYWFRNETSIDDHHDNPFGLVDTGFLLTTPIYKFLATHRDWNDWLAAINSLALVIPSIYASYVTVWLGDYTLVFRILFTQIMRSFCGWFTYLPPDPTYLPSYYDFPDIVHCLFQECQGAPKTLPFVSFFSGHVATMVISGNHLWLHGYMSLSILVHALNVFQIVRLLATRGHYSIDIIIGWYMAIVVSNRAARLGRYYSRGVPIQEIMPVDARDAFETVTGVKEAREEARMSLLMKESQVKDILQKLLEDDGDDALLGPAGDGTRSNTNSKDIQHAETTLRMIHNHVEMTAKKLQQRIKQFQQEKRSSNSKKE